MLIDIDESVFKTIDAKVAEFNQKEERQGRQPIALPRHERLGVGLYGGYGLGFDLCQLGGCEINDAPFDPSFMFGDEGLSGDDLFRKRMKKLREESAAGRMLDGYGVCDYPEQVAERWPHIEADPRHFVIQFIRFSKDAGDEGEVGFRWHKSGEYIGTQDTDGGEYFGENDNAITVYLFHLYEIVSQP